MEPEATQGQAEVVPSDESGADTNGADNAGNNGSGVPSTLAAALTPPTPPTKATKMVSQEKVNKIAANAREEGRNAALKEILSLYEIDSEDELQVLVSEGRKVRPAPKDKIVTSLEQKLAEQERQIAELRQRDEIAAIERTCYPHLTDTHDPDLSLQAIIRATGIRPSVKNGVVVLLDGDGDEVDLTVAHWLKNGKARVRYMVKSTVEPAITAQKIVTTKTEAEAAARDEVTRGSDPRYRQREVLKILQSAAVKASR